jgi:hypothetical protein
VILGKFIIALMAFVVVMWLVGELLRQRKPK